MTLMNHNQTTFHTLDGLPSFLDNQTFSTLSRVVQ